MRAPRRLDDPSPMLPCDFLARLALASLLLAAPLHAATILVDGSQCSLADAVAAANTDAAVGGCTAGSGADTLSLQADALLTGARGSLQHGAGAALPDVVSAITLAAAPAGTPRRIERNPAWNCAAVDPDAFRLITVDAGGDLTLRGVTLANGCVAPFSGDAAGGAILVDGGRLTLDAVRIEGSRARSKDGQAAGGAIAAWNGADVRATASTFAGNLVSSDDNLAADAQSGDGLGGALFLSGSASRLAVDTSLLDDNAVLPGSAQRGGSGCGGAIALQQGTLSLRSSLLRANHAHGGGTTQSTPGIGRGGALCQTDGVLGAIGSTFAGNEAVGGSGPGMYSDGAGIGGGLAVSGAQQSRLENVTVSGNLAAGGHALTRGYGGGIGLETAGVVLARVTVADNQVQGNTGTQGAGLWLNYDASVFETLIADNSGGSDCAASTPNLNWSAGYNLLESGSGCDSVASDLRNIDPLLQPLADNGCSAALHLPDGSCVPTHAIAQSGSGSGATFVLTPSPALDASLCLEGPGLTDARGTLRPQDLAGLGGSATAACDIGAFEAVDSDGDGVTDSVDQCLGNDASGDADHDGVCTDRDDDDGDPAVGVSLFADGFELRG